jgi:hypothetical protein
MDQIMLLYTAIFVFALMITGLVLTMWEFSRGAPREQADTRSERPVRARVVRSTQRM